MKEITEGSIVVLNDGNGITAEVTTVMGKRLGVEMAYNSTSGMPSTRYKEVSKDSVKLVCE